MDDPNVESEEQRKRESGSPGGGKGRKDEVGRSGVYPMSGPHPPGAAEIKPQASWGQGDRGAAGYEDHGSSELSIDRSGQVLGGIEGGAGDVQVPRERWTSFLDSFSREHMDWLATIEIRGPVGAQTEVNERRFKGVSHDLAEGTDHAYVHMGDTPEEHLTHIINNPAAITLKRSETGAHQGLEIESRDGSTTLVRFRTAMRPDNLDNIAA